MSFFAILKDFNLLFFKDRSAKLFAVATIFGLSFSIAIILCTLGLMDGFTAKLKEALNEGHGEVVITSQKGFFYPNSSDFKNLGELGVETTSYMIKTQSFAINKDVGKAVIVIGVNETFSEINPNFAPPKSGEVVIGKTLAKELKIEERDSLALTFSSGRSGEKYLPNTVALKVRKITSFKIHNFDERFVYANLGDIQNFLGVDGRVNMAKLKLKEELTHPQKVESVVDELRSIFFFEYRITPYWSEFSTYIRAVEFEKYMISIVLSIVVVIAAFNCLAFIIYSKEKKAQEVFLLYSIGLSPRKFKRLWLIQNTFIWLISFVFAMGFVQVFGHALMTWDMFALPSDVYYLGRIEIELGLKDILFVMGISFTFIYSLTYLVLKRLDAKSLAHGLREEFS